MATVEEQRTKLMAELKEAKQNLGRMMESGDKESAAQIAYIVIPDLERALTLLDVGPDVERRRDLKAMENFLDVVWPKWRTHGEMEDTPRRILDGWKELLSGDEEFTDWKTFDTEYTGIIARIGVPVYAICAHHLLPYVGTINFAYIPDKKKLGISKIIRWLQHRCRVPSSQEELTERLVNEFMERVKPLGVMLRFDAKHMCEGLRGVKVMGVGTRTESVRGILLDNEKTRQEAISLFQSGGNE